MPNFNSPFILLSLCAFGTTYDTVLYVRAGSCAGAELACSNDAGGGSCGGTKSQIFPLSVTAGETYYVIVDGDGGASGNYSLFVIQDVPA